MAVAHGRRVLQAGEKLETAHAAMILLHGRGATAEDIMTIAAEFDQPGWSYLAPQSAGNAWYPNPFTSPIESNEPYLSAALEMVSRLVGEVEAHVPTQRVALLGFSQGACLALEWAARNARRYGAVFGLSGGLIGPDGTQRDYASSFDGMPAFFGCSDVDPFIRKERVSEAAEVYERMGAEVTLRLYPGLGHQVNADEIGAIREVIRSI
ncbi:MAG TPA: alpha/beta fold hydrolase [Candidatus Udaeobacter sp.]|nr:alpha/beta fold hydrolase [Candidatus Udaeobacter sp.]